MYNMHAHAHHTMQTYMFPMHVRTVCAKMQNDVDMMLCQSSSQPTGCNNITMQGYNMPSGDYLQCSINIFTRTLNEEHVVSVPGRVLLRLEECIKVPERALNEVVAWLASRSVNLQRQLQ